MKITGIFVLLVLQQVLLAAAACSSGSPSIPTPTATASGVTRADLEAALNTLPVRPETPFAEPDVWSTFLGEPLVTRRYAIPGDDSRLLARFYNEEMPLAGWQKGESAVALALEADYVPDPRQLRYAWKWSRGDVQAIVIIWLELLVGIMPNVTRVDILLSGRN